MYVYVYIYIYIYMPTVMVHPGASRARFARGRVFSESGTCKAMCHIHVCLQLLVGALLVRTPLSFREKPRVCSPIKLPPIIVKG